MRRKKSTPAHTHSRNGWHTRVPFFVILGFTTVLALGSGVWLKSQNDTVVAKQYKYSQQLRQADERLQKIKNRLTTEKKARDDAAIAAKKASDAALASGIVPTPSHAAVTAGGPHMDSSKVDVLVNKKHPLNPVSYAPNVTTADCAGGGSATIHALAASDFTAMCHAAAVAGVPLGISSSYRSYATQISTYNRWVSQSGIASADTYSARPGYSEHQTGLAIDFRVPGGAALNDFTGTPQQQWLATHAHTFGFIQRYTENNTAVTGYTAESWHYRYIGRDTAAAYVAAGASSLEAFWRIPGGDY